MKEIDGSIIVELLTSGKHAEAQRLLRNARVSDAGTPGPFTIKNWTRPSKPLPDDFDLTYAHFARADFFNVTAHHVLLEHARLDGCSFSHAYLTSGDFQDSSCLRTRFDSATLIDTSFDGARLQGAFFRSCDLHGSVFKGADFRGTDLTAAKGLFGPRRARTYDALNGDCARFHARADFLSWRVIAIVTSIGIERAGYLATALLLFYSFAATHSNAALSRIREYAGTHVPAPPGAWIANVPDLPMPWHLGAQLLAFVFLAIFSTMARSFGPDLIREFKEISWVRVQKQSVVEWRSANWSQRTARYLLGIPAVLATGWTIGYLLMRVAWAITKYF